MSSCDHRDMWLFILKYALGVVTRFVRNSLFVLLAAALACVFYFPFLDVILAAMGSYGRGGTEFPAALALTDPVLRECLFASEIGFLFALPGLFLIYFPAAWMLWLRQRGMATFAVVSTGVACVNGAGVLLLLRLSVAAAQFWRAPDPFEWLVLASFISVGLLTGTIHYKLMTAWIARDKWLQRLRKLSPSCPPTTP